MGRQVNFCMHPDEEETFLTFLETIPSLKILLSHTSDENLIINVRDLNQFPHSQVYIFNEAWGIEPAYVMKTEIMKYSISSKQLEYIGEHAYSVGNVFNGPMIEYNRCIINKDGKLTSGRIWAEMYRIEEDQFVDKDEDFIKLYEKITSWLKKNMRLEKDGQYYLSPKAEKWFAKRNP